MQTKNGGCAICPRKCKRDRSLGEIGFCGAKDQIRIARYSLHEWEEPPISGKNGSGTIFFSGCNLRCVFCQNHDVSHKSLGWDISDEELEQIMLRLRDMGAHNINLVTPTHYTERIASVLARIKPKLGIPIVWNSSAYESVETLSLLDGLVDVYLPDFKYFSSDLAKRYSCAEDYPGVAMTAIREMYRQVGAVSFDSDGMINKGIIVRHLVLPGCRKDSIDILNALAGSFSVKDIRISLMSQYTPDFAIGCGYKNLERRITGFEYSSVLDAARALGFEGYFQDRTSATCAYTPEFYSNDINKS